jgi:hypothetical protein
MTEHRLVGLDGSNPLAFFAALGVLQALADAGVTANLRWELQGRWRPFLRVALDEEALVALLDADRDKVAWGQELHRDLVALLGPGCVRAPVSLGGRREESARRGPPGRTTAGVS